MHVIVEKVTDVAEIPSKLNLTILTVLLGPLNMSTFVTLDLSDGMLVHEVATIIWCLVIGIVLTAKIVHVIFIEFGVIVTIPATKELLAFGTTNFASPSIVMAPELIL